MSHEQSHGGSAGHGGYEPSDAHVGAIAKFLFWLFFATALVLVSMYGLVKLSKEMPRPNEDIALHPLAVERQVPSEPRLEALRGISKGVYGATTDEAEASYFNRKMFKQWNAEWKTDLDSYKYIDQQIGLARIPIERAMEMKLKQGFPTAKKTN